MKPKLQTIEELSKQISQDIIRDVLPQINSVGKIGEDVGKLLEGYTVEQEIRRRVTPGLDSPDYLLCSIRLLYEVNADCNGKIRQLTNELYALRSENNSLKEEISHLREETGRQGKEEQQQTYQNGRSQ